MRTRTSVSSNSSKTYHSGCLKAGIAAITLGFALSGIAHAQSTSQGGNPGVSGSNLDQRVMSTLQECQKVSPSCASVSKSAAGILVFPTVTKVDLILGGAGGKGALIENGRIAGYYSIGAGSAGLQAGIDQSSQVYVFRTAEALSHLKAGSDWKVGADAEVTVVNANANATTTNGNILTYVFNSSGLEGGAAVNVFDVWKTDQPRPQYTSAPANGAAPSSRNP